MKEKRIPVSEQRLLLGGKTLGNDATVASLKMSDKSILLLFPQSSGGEGNMQIFIKPLTAAPFVITVKPSDSVAQIKLVIMQQKQIPVSEQSLSFRNRNVQNNMTVASLQITANCTLLLVRVHVVYGGTSMHGDSCFFPFAFAGSLHYSCTSAGKRSPWCFTTADSKRWGYCGLAAAPFIALPSVTMWGGSSRVNDTCSFPFPFNNSLHSTCVSSPSLDRSLRKPWCLTLQNGKWARWGYCLNASALDRVPVWGGSSITGDTCAFPFAYQGALHAECIRADRGSPWCFSATNLSRWGFCGFPPPPPPPKVVLMGIAGKMFSNAPTSGAQVRAYTIASVYSTTSTSLPLNTSFASKAVSNGTGVFSLWLEPGHYHLHFSSPEMPDVGHPKQSTLAALAPSVFSVSCQAVQHCMFSREGALALTCTDRVHKCDGACTVKTFDRLNVMVRRGSVTCYPLASVEE
jgi:hypothetical protein